MRPASTSLLTLAAVLCLSACSAEKSEQSAAAAADASGESAAAVGPDIPRSIAPGVAFTYNYQFSLPAKAISAVQREHAKACQQLGVNRCRITDMSFDQSGEDQASGRIAFLLAPDIAQSFAADGVAAVEKADGKLDNAAVAGENAGDQIKLSQSNSADLQAEAQRLQARLDAKGLTAAERAELQRQLSDIQAQLRGGAEERKAKEQAIATTPVNFSYSSQGLLSGQGNVFGNAAMASWSSARGVFGLLAVVAGFALPWALLAALVLFAWRGIKARRNAATPPAVPAAEPAPLQ